LDVHNSGKFCLVENGPAKIECEPCRQKALPENRADKIRERGGIIFSGEVSAEQQSVN